MSEEPETFTNEDHLSSHQKRHEMSLLLPGGITISRSNSLTLGADQTPTPTRFIRMGEEVGLFQDLLKANPFDEQFRKAAEQNKAASVNLALPFSGACDEPLNTPHIVHPGEGDHHPAKGAAAPAVDTPQPRLASPHRLGSPPPAHVVVTPCGLPRSRGGAPPAHRDPLDPEGSIDIDDDMEVEGPLDMRSPSVMPPVSETLISSPVIHTPGSLTSPPVIHAAGPLSSPPVIHVQGTLGHQPGSLGSPHGVPTPGSAGGSLGSPPSSHTPTTLQSSTVSSTVAIPRHHQLTVPITRSRPAQHSTAALPPAHSGPHAAALAGPHAAALHGTHSGALPGAHTALPGGLAGSLPVAHQASQPGGVLPAHQSSQPGGPPLTQLAETVPGPADGVEFQLKLSDGLVIPLAMHPEEAAAAAARMQGRLGPSPAGGHTAPAGEMAVTAGVQSTVRERLKRSLQRQERPPAVPTPTVQPPPPPPPPPGPPAAIAQPPASQPRTSQSEDSLRKERNRAAANRWRARKKRAQQQMANSVEALTCNVSELRHENAELRAQITKLKLILARHRDCDVSRGLKPPADADGPSRMELEDISRLMSGDPTVSCAAVTAAGAAAAGGGGGGGGGGLVSPAEEVRRVARPAGMVRTAAGSVPPSAPSVPLVFTSGQAAVSTLPVPSGGGATHQLILLQPAPAGGTRLPQPAPTAQPPPQQQPPASMGPYRLPAASAAGRVTLQPPLAHGDRL